MVERFQQPHYGESFKPALTYNDRTLAFSKHLPLLQWDSAVHWPYLVGYNISGEYNTIRLY